MLIIVGLLSLFLLALGAGEALRSVTSHEVLPAAERRLAQASLRDQAMLDVLACLDAARVQGAMPAVAGRGAQTPTTRAGLLPRFPDYTDPAWPQAGSPRPAPSYTTRASVTAPPLTAEPAGPPGWLASHEGMDVLLFRRVFGIPNALATGAPSGNLLQAVRAHAVPLDTFVALDGLTATLAFYRASVGTYRGLRGLPTSMSAAQAQSLALSAAVPLRDHFPAGASPSIPAANPAQHQYQTFGRQPLDQAYGALLEDPAGCTLRAPSLARYGPAGQPQALRPWSVVVRDRDASPTFTSVVLASPGRTLVTPVSRGAVIGAPVAPQPAAVRFVPGAQDASEPPLASPYHVHSRGVPQPAGIPMLGAAGLPAADTPAPLVRPALLPSDPAGLRITAALDRFLPGDRYRTFTGTAPLRGSASDQDAVLGNLRRVSHTTRPAPIPAGGLAADEAAVAAARSAPAGTALGAATRQAAVYRPLLPVSDADLAPAALTGPRPRHALLALPGLPAAAAAFDAADPAHRAAYCRFHAMDPCPAVLPTLDWHERRAAAVVGGVLIPHYGFYDATVRDPRRARRGPRCAPRGRAPVPLQLHRPQPLAGLRRDLRRPAPRLAVLPGPRRLPRRPRPSRVPRHHVHPPPADPAMSRLPAISMLELVLVLAVVGVAAYSSIAIYQGLRASVASDAQSTELVRVVRAIHDYRTRAGRIEYLGTTYTAGATSLVQSQLVPEALRATGTLRLPSGSWPVGVRPGRPALADGPLSVFSDRQAVLVVGDANSPVLTTADCSTLLLTDFPGRLGVQLGNAADYATDGITAPVATAGIGSTWARPFSTAGSSLGTVPGAANLSPLDDLDPAAAQAACRAAVATGTSFVVGFGVGRPGDS